MIRCCFIMALCALFFVDLASAGAQMALEGATVHTVSDKVIDDATVVVDAKGLIVSVGPRASVTVPDGYARISIKGKVLTPGLMDVNTSLGAVEIWSVASTNDTFGGKGHVRAAARAADGINPDSAVIPIQRSGGVTDVLVVPSGGIVSGQSAWMHTGGKGHFGHVARDAVAMHVYMDDSPRRRSKLTRVSLMRLLRTLVSDVKLLIANKQAFDQNRTRKLIASALDLAAVSQTMGSDPKRMPVFLHAERSSDIVVGVKWAKAAGMRPVIVGGAQAWRVRAFLSAQKVSVVVNPMFNLPSTFEELGARADNAALLNAAGVKVVLSAFEAHNVRRLRQMAGNAVRAGLPHDQALRAVTLRAARVAGVDAQIGSVEAGKLANLVVWSGDPFELSTKVERMFIKGKPVSLKNRQDALFQRYRAKAGSAPASTAPTPTAPAPTLVVPEPTPTASEPTPEPLPEPLPEPTPEPTPDLTPEPDVETTP